MGRKPILDRAKFTENGLAVDRIGPIARTYCNVDWNAMSKVECWHLSGGGGERVERDSSS
jgi:hypothetical protein